MENEVKMILEELRKMDQDTDVTWSQLNISQELYDLLYEYCIMNGDDIAGIINLQNETIDNIDNEEKTKNKNIIDSLEYDDHVLFFNYYTLEYFYLTASVLIDELNKIPSKYKKVSI